MGKPGYNASLSVGVSPTVCGKMKDVTLDQVASAIDISTRDGAGWKKFIQGLKEWSISGEQLWVPDDTAYELIETAFRAGSEIAVSMLDVAGAGGHGWTGNAIVTKLGRGEPLDGALVVPVELKGTGALTVVDPA